MKTNLVDMVPMLKGGIFQKYSCLSAIGIDLQRIKIAAAFFSVVKGPHYASLQTGNINALQENDCVFFSPVISFVGVNFTHDTGKISKGRMPQKKIKQVKEIPGLNSSLSYFLFFSHIYLTLSNL